MSASEPSFAHLVSLACHDLRTPLATVSGFARTLVLMDDVGEQMSRYLGIIEAASGQLSDLLDDLSLVARIEGGRWEPLIHETDTRSLANAAVERLGDAASASGTGAPVAVETDTVERALCALARCAVRHGGLERVDVKADGASVTIAPVPPDAADICLGRDLRDLGAAVAVRTIDALGGATDLEGETLVVRLPLAPVVG